MWVPKLPIHVYIFGSFYDDIATYARMSSKRNKLLKHEKVNYGGWPTFAQNLVNFGPQTAEIMQ